MLVAGLTPVLLCVVGLTWEHLAVEEFARVQGNHDLFQTWVGKERFDYTYDYRGQNRHYEFWAIRLPFLATAGTFAISFGVAAWALRRRGHSVANLCVLGLWNLAVLAFFLYETGLRWFENSGIFI
jgi:hypothetical protein